jgi:uncharacterized protein (DUF58 family)
VGSAAAQPESRTPYPGVAFASDYVRRLERLTLRLSAAGERREGAGSAALAGGGDEFVGYRPYRPGEDLRQLAWDLLARLDRPYVRVTRREAAERWALLIDVSASMGVGPPGKLQAAAELAGAVACAGLRRGARIELWSSDGAAPYRARRVTDLPGILRFLESLRAAGQRGLGDLCASTRVGRGCGRLVLFGDLLDLEPQRVARLRAPGRELLCAQVLAPVELAPQPGLPVEWLDPEGDGRLACSRDQDAILAYERALKTRLSAWDEVASRHGITHAVHPSERPFEDGARTLLAP